MPTEDGVLMQVRRRCQGWMWERSLTSMLGTVALWASTVHGTSPVPGFRGQVPSVSLQRGVSSKILPQLYKMVPAILGALPSRYRLYLIPGLVFRVCLSLGPACSASGNPSFFPVLLLVSSSCLLSCYCLLSCWCGYVRNRTQGLTYAGQAIHC